MIEVLLSHTLEVDEIELALRDVLTQLNLGKRLRKHSMGIIHCTQEFVSSGVVKALCERLPFPVVGINSLLNSSSLGLMDNMLLTLAVLTSDNVKFATGLSGPLEPFFRASLMDMYVDTENLLSSRPSFMLIFGPSLLSCAIGEKIVETLDEASDNVPMFGSLAADYSTQISNPRVIYNGESYSTRAAVVLVEGNLNPRFFSFPVPTTKAIQQKAIITASENNLVKEVNGVPVLEFMESLGLCWDGQISGTHSIPIFLDRNDGFPPTVRTIQCQTPEGYIILCGDAPVDTTLGIGAMDQKEVLDSIIKASNRVRLLAPDVFLLYSCLSRNIILGLDYLAEIEALHNNLRDQINYIFAYSSGEICPVLFKDGKLHNQFHNMTLISLAF
jgi:hypothetical protein